MGLKVSHHPVFLFFLTFASLNAAPTLRLSSATSGPVSVALGANGSGQTIQATNIGDGALALSLSSSVPWAVPTMGTPAPCAAFPTPCIPILIGLQSASLAKGTYTGIVTVSDPNAVDAPQDITVTVQVGGDFPDKVDLYVAPDGGAAEATFNTNAPLNGAIATADNQRWLSFSLTGTASFRFTYPYRLAVTGLPGMSEGDYTGTVTTSGSPLAADNKTIGVTMHVTSQPIAQVTPAALMVRLAQGAPTQTYNLTFSNAGLGTLRINQITTISGPGTEDRSLGALNKGLTITVYIDPAGLSPGQYQGSLLVNTNAANGQVTIPIGFQVVPQGAPVVTFQGVRDSVLFATDPLAPGELAVAMGEQFDFGDSSASITVNDVPAPITSVAYGQIGFQVPYGILPGTGILRVQHGGQVSNAVSFTVVDRAPRLMLLGSGDYGAIVNQDGTNPIPLAVDGINHPAHPGDLLKIFGTGFGQTDPPALTGAQAPSDEPLWRLPITPDVTFGGGFSGTAVTLQPQFAGLAPGMVGIYEFDVIVPDDVQTGASVPVTVTIAGTMSNPVRLAIDPAP